MTIDYVVPMVFPNDLKWRHEYLAANGLCRDDRSTLSNERYRTWGTEELLIRLIRKNLPWIRTIHIILARPSQVQPWMEQFTIHNSQFTINGPQLRVVFHKDFIPEDKLPTFNSRAIEMYLCRIPDLAPYFLYGNDDMFPLAPMGADEFFRPAADGDMLPCLTAKRKAFNPGKPFHQACMNGMNFVAAEFGKHYDTEWIHMGHNIMPMVRRTCEMFWERWPEKMSASVTPFRQWKNFNQYIYSWWQILSEKYVEHKPTRGYVSTSNTEEEIVNAIRTAEGLLCINDNEAVRDITNIAAVVRNELQKRL